MKVPSLLSDPFLLLTGAQPIRSSEPGPGLGAAGGVPGAGLNSLRRAARRGGGRRGGGGRARGGRSRGPREGEERRAAPRAQVRGQVGGGGQVGGARWVGGDPGAGPLLGGGR